VVSTVALPMAWPSPTPTSKRDTVRRPSAKRRVDAPALQPRHALPCSRRAAKLSSLSTGRAAPSRTVRAQHRPACWPASMGMIAGAGRTTGGLDVVTRRRARRGGDAFDRPLPDACLRARAGRPGWWISLVN
jgi:hypothetical protein